MLNGQQKKMVLLGLDLVLGGTASIRVRDLVFGNASRWKQTDNSARMSMRGSLSAGSDWVRRTCG
jgi:hypothetical protein